MYVEYKEAKQSEAVRFLSYALEMLAEPNSCPKYNPKSLLSTLLSVYRLYYSSLRRAFVPSRIRRLLSKGKAPGGWRDRLVEVQPR